MNIKKQLKEQFGWMQKGDFKLLEKFIEEVTASIRVEKRVMNFFADLNETQLIMLKTTIRWTLIEVMKQYFKTMLKGKRYIANIDFFYLPDAGAKEIIKQLKLKSKKDL